METYRKKMIFRINMLIIIAIITAALYLGLLFFHGQLPTLPSMFKGMHFGAFIGIELFLIISIVNGLRIIRNETVLKQSYVKENDERTALIIQKTATLSVTIIMIGILIAAITAGFFSSSIFYTLMGTLFFVLIVFYSLWIYYAKKH